jgi:uncharacterized membrane protein
MATWKIYFNVGICLDFLTLLRGFAAVITIIAAVLIASNWSPKTMVAGFVLFIAASLAWILDGWLEEVPSLFIQNVVLLLINIFGVFRWLPKT